MPDHEADHSPLFYAWSCTFVGFYGVPRSNFTLGLKTCLNSIKNRV
jgi:hypothetical protein